MGQWQGIVVAGALALTASSAGAADYTYINIGTAGLGGGFYPAGGAICNMVNKTRNEYGHNLRCTVEATAGSLGNLRAIAAGDLEVALANPEWQWAAYEGERAFEGQAMPELRHLMGIHSDAWHLVVRPDAGIESFEDLKGKIVNTGNVGSGTEGTVYLLLQEIGWDPETDFAQEAKLTSREQAQALCDGNIDAFLFSSGLPGPSVTEAISTCGAKVLPWQGPEIEKLMAAYPFFSKMEIPGGTYENHPLPIPTWGIQSTVVTTERLPEDAAYNIVKSVFDNFEEYTGQSPMFTGLTREAAAVNGRTAPYHPGALKYFKEVGLVE